MFWIDRSDKKGRFEPFVLSPKYNFFYNSLFLIVFSTCSWLQYLTKMNNFGTIVVVVYSDTYFAVVHRFVKFISFPV